MLGLLLFISFILHGIAFYWIYQLKKQKNENPELENALAVYLDDMKEDHDQLIRFLKGFQKKASKPTYMPDSVPENEPAANIKERRPVSNDKNYVPPAAPDDIEDRFESSFEAQVLSLAKQGFQYDEIAKKLGRGKGEVELLIRLDQAKKDHS
ncbi:MAG TPA: hypothetical protein VFK37_07265 [Bacillales bacterium]|nr:hypothetical protein [Bacillales bacterium]